MSFRLFRTAVGALTLSLGIVLTAGASSNADRRMDILGWIETVQLKSAGFAVDAKLDTGADNSSLNAPEIEEFEKDGDTWVRFSVTNSEDEEATFEKPLYRTVRIRSAAGVSRRPVVKMAICLGDTLREVEVNLADRSELSYQMLIGRSFMKDHILVDSGRRYTAEPNCGDQQEDEDD